jgi:sugar lactone lactonase YvrE
MNAKSLNALLIALVICFGWSIAWSAQSPFPANATFTTLIRTPLAIEGLTGDNSGNLYTVGRHNANNTAEFGLPCPVWKINLTTPSLVEVGSIQAPDSSSVCAPLGLAFNKAGDLFVADGNRISFLTPNAVTPPTASVYATGVPGTNGLAFDHNGNLWTGDGGTGGGTGLGRVWKITASGADCNTADHCEEVFRIQPMNNGSTFGGTFRLNPGVGRVNATMQPNGTPANNPQNLVANGLAFNAQGNLLVADTARGALWLVTFDKNGDLVSKLGCDATFSDNTLCLENLFRADPRLEGVDGIALDISGDIWASVNERNAIVFTVFFGTSDSVEVFRNPVNGNSGLRNAGDLSVGNSHILEFPTSPFLSGTKFCTANGDNNRRDNSPSNAGEIGVAPFLGKISCMDQPLGTSGLPLPR